jgi:hypothetical protein
MVEEMPLPAGSKTGESQHVQHHPERKKKRSCSELLNFKHDWIRIDDFFRVKPSILNTFNNLQVSGDCLIASKSA